MAARSWIRSCLAIGVAAVCLAAWLAYDLNASHERLLRRVQAATKEDAARAAGEIDQNLRQASAALDALTSDLSAGRLSAEALGARLEAILEADPELLGVGVAYAPLGSRALYAPYRTRRGGKFHALHLEDSIRAGVPWYRDALREGADWREPTWDEVEDSNTATYSAPFFGSDDTTPIGVALVSISIDRVRDRVDELDTGAAGWGVILSRETTFLAHPDEQRVEDRVKVKDLVGSDPNEVLPKLKRAAERGESVFFENIEQTTGRNAWFFLEPVPATGWTLGLVRLEDEVVVEGRTHRRRVIRAGLVAILGLLLLGVPATAAAHARRPGLAALWGVAAWSSLLMIAGIEVIRSATYDQVSDEQRRPPSSPTRTACRPSSPARGPCGASGTRRRPSRFAPASWCAHWPSEAPRRSSSPACCGRSSTTVGTTRSRAAWICPTPSKPTWRRSTGVGAATGRPWAGASRRRCGR
jgi:hypothetical protein